MHGQKNTKTTTSVPPFVFGFPLS